MQKQLILQTVNENKTTILDKIFADFSTFLHYFSTQQMKLYYYHQKVTVRNLYINLFILYEI